MPKRTLAALHMTRDVVCAAKRLRESEMRVKSKRGTQVELKWWSFRRNMQRNELKALLHAYALFFMVDERCHVLRVNGSHLLAGAATPINQRYIGTGMRVPPFSFAMDIHVMQGDEPVHYSVVTPGLGDAPYSDVVLGSKKNWIRLQSERGDTLDVPRPWVKWVVAIEYRVLLALWHRNSMFYILPKELKRKVGDCARGEFD